MNIVLKISLCTDDMQSDQRMCCSLLKLQYTILYILQFFELFSTDMSDI